MKTEKLYINDKYLYKCEAEIVEISNKGIVTNRTVAFPEGGGQVGDSGLIITDRREHEFVDTQQGAGRMLYLQDFPSVQVEAKIYHVVKQESLEELNVGDKVIIQIDLEKRMKLMALHSALHIVIMGAITLRDGLYKKIKGCKISPEGARVDFNLRDNKFNQEDIIIINEYSNKIIDENIEVLTYSHDKEEQALFWKCKDFICPCGGTHVDMTGQIGKIIVSRKNVGKSCERLNVKLADNLLIKNFFNI